MANAEAPRLPPLRALRSRHELSLRKGLGQHLLCNQRILQRIVQCCRLTPESAVIEIGAGFGHLTCQLARHARHVLAIEYDERFRPIHEQYLSATSNIKVLYKDILRVDFQQLLRDLNCEKPVIVGNIPYRITSRIVLKCLEELPTFAKIVLMMQQEVAERIVSQPGKKTFGILPLKVQFFSKPKLEFLVGRKNFVPRPNVDSAVVSFVPLERKNILPGDDWRHLFGFIDVIFRYRRKSLKTVIHMSGLSSRSKANIQCLLESLGIDPLLRPESLSLDGHITLYKALEEGRRTPAQGS
jgi:16S rRNA (adenine1518-N6/adenine1519-N6)-dimethyltransferase